MGAREIINKVMRILLLVCAALLVLLYVLGIIANVFGLLEMRRSDETVRVLLYASAGDRAVVGGAEYEGGVISYAAVHAAGPQDSIAVIFVHGSPGSLDAFTGYLLDAHLQAHASQFTYDRLGYGNSTPKQAGKSLVEQSEQLFAFAQAITAKRKIYVGHSLGCSIMARLAMDHPEVVQGMVMIAAPIDPALEPSSWWRPLLEIPMIRIAMPHSFVISNRELVSLKKDLEACLLLWSRVQCPVLFIHGDRDKLVPLENVAFGKNVLVNARVSENILEGEGHFMLWTHEEVIVDGIIEMIDE